MSKEFAGIVTDIRLESRADGVDRWQMAVSGTSFREGDTGVFEARARSGTRLVVQVLSVTVDDDGDVWHVVAKPLAAGTEVTGRVSV